MSKKRKERVQRMEREIGNLGSRMDALERLDSVSRERLYAKCKAKGLQLIATKVTDSEEMEVIEL